MISARRAAETDSSIVVQSVRSDRSHDSKSPENNRVVESLSKSKARRLRKRNQIENSKISDKISSAKPEIINPTSQEELIIGSTETRTNDEFPEGTKVTASEHELFQNEKNRKISEKSSNDLPRRINDEHAKSLIGEIITESETTRRKLKESTGNSTKNVEGLILKMENHRVSTTSTEPIGRMNSHEKSRDEIKAEREAKKAAKAAAKNKLKAVKPEVAENVDSSPNSNEDSLRKLRESRGDVVDGEIIPKFNKITTAPVANSKLEANTIVPQTDSNIEVKSKSELRAERRAKQEAQRAAKQNQVLEKQKPKLVNAIPPEVEKSAPEKIDDTKKIDKTKKIVKSTVVNAHEVNLFKHLYQEREQALINVPTVNSNIHPAIVRLGVQYADKVIVGSNARCVALLAALKQLIHDFERPSQADFTRGLEASLQESSAYLHHCRPLAVSMQNALRHLKWQMTQLDATTSDEDVR